MSRPPRFPLPPVVVFLVLRCGYAFAFALFAIYSNVRRVVELGFDPLELVVVGTVLEASVFLFEVPTGVVADVVSRRLSIVVGHAVIAAGFALEAFSTGFLSILVAQAIWGIGWTFLSGARSAWLADEIGADAAVPVFLRASQLGQGAALVGIAAAAPLALVSLTLPLWAAAGAFALLSLTLALTMTEDGFSPAPREERETFVAMARTFRGGLREARGNSTVALLIGVALFAGASSEGFDRLWQLHVLALSEFSLPSLAGAPGLTWFALIDAVALVVGIGVMAWVRRTLGSMRADERRRAALPRLLAVLQAAALAAAVGFAWAGSFAWALLAWWALLVARRTQAPLASAWVNQRLPSPVRATVLSMLGQSDSLGQVAGGPALGLLGRVHGVRAALLAGGALLVPPLLLFLRAARGGGPTDADAAPPGSPPR